MKIIKFICPNCHKEVIKEKEDDIDIPECSNKKCKNYKGKMVFFSESDKSS